MQYGENIEIINCICCWYDLLGFGEPFIQSNWDLNNNVCKKNIERITNLNGLLSFSHMSHLWKALLLNDGVIKVHDIIPNDKKYILDLIYALTSIVMDFEWINQIDSAKYPGLRGVVTYGHRYNYIHGDIDHLVNIGQDVVYHPREFQMNTAFSKAYIMEESGSKKGIIGNKLYFDKLLLDKAKNLLNSSSVFSFEEELVDEQYTCIISNADRYLLKLNFGSTPIYYENMGINTSLYSLIGYKSHIDEDLQEYELQRARILSKINEDSTNS